MLNKSTVHGQQSTVDSPPSTLSTPLKNYLILPALSFKLLALRLLPLALSLLLSACSKTTDSKTSSPSIKAQQYYVQGEQLYTKHCSNCHQKNGTGLGLLYPPLNKSDYMDKNFEAVICLMKKGIKGELTVNGKSFNKEMRGIPSLTDLEIAEIATYIYNSWEHQRDTIDIRDVSRILNQCNQNK